MDTSPTTPGPSPMHGQSISPTSGMPRRPPRKSTLTQQQKNQKRQRATQDQLITLEVEFEKNPTPTALVRDRIAQDINMTERSVQIWFQNRRAKIKNMVKKSIENGEDSNEIPESMKRYLALQALETGKPLGRDYMVPRFGNNGVGGIPAYENSSHKVVIHHFTCRSLTVGSWRRIGQTAMDLVVFYSPDKETVTYYINNDSAGYKIEYRFEYIKNITLDNGDPNSSAEGASHGGIIIELNRPPHFYMDSSGSGGFYEVGDFTEDQQASKVMTHYLGGQAKVLSGQLARLLALEPFYNRHRKEPVQFQPSIPHKIAIGTMQPPATPPVHRPSSQPTQFLDDTRIHLMAEAPVGLPGGLHPPRGHKRQRSRSVPVAIDWTMMRGGMPSWLQQNDAPLVSPFIQNHDVLSPMPIYTPQAQHSPMPLSIDTNTPFGMDFSQYPMSATTAPSPSDFGTPALFPGSHGPNNASATDLSTPFTLAMMSPMQPTMGPLPINNGQMSVGDPIIANQSPTLNSLNNGPHDAELYLGQDGQMLNDDSLGLQNFQWETKQPTVSLPMRPTGLPEHSHEEAQNGPVAFLDPSTLTNSQM